MNGETLREVRGINSRITTHLAGITRFKLSLLKDRRRSVDEIERTLNEYTAKVSETVDALREQREAIIASERNKLKNKLYRPVATSVSDQAAYEMLKLQYSGLSGPELLKAAESVGTEAGARAILAVGMARGLTGVLEVCESVPETRKRLSRAA
jgi:hypothetical protein